MLPNSDSDSKGVPRPHDVNWIYSTFTSRATAEALLSPERESGNLTTNDYNNAIQFLPGAHRYYPIAGFAAGVVLSVWVHIRNPRLSRAKQLSLVTVTFLTCHMLGVAGQIYAHVNYLHNIENPDGHKRAMNNVQKIVPFRGINFMPFMRSRPYQISPDDASNQPTSEHDSSSTERSQSKWDQIRATNSRTAQSSAWDARRQQHEIIRVKPNPQDRDDDKWTSEKF